MKNQFCHSLAKSRFQSFACHFFRTSEKCFSIVIPFNLKSFPLRNFWQEAGKNYIVLFIRKSRLQALLSDFSLYFRGFFFQSDSNQLEEISFAYRLVVTRNFFISHAASLHFWKKIISNFFCKIEILNLSFTLFLLVQRLIFQICFKCVLDFLVVNYSFFIQTLH